MRKILLNQTDFGLFDNDITSTEYDFFRRHKDVFKQMFSDQGKEFWIRFVMTFRKFSMEYGVSKDYPTDSAKYIEFVDEAFILIHENFVEVKASDAIYFILDIVVVAQHKTPDSITPKKRVNNPFYVSDTRNAYRKLFGNPTDENSYLKVFILLPLYCKFGGAICKCLRKWREAPELQPNEKYWTSPSTSRKESIECESKAASLPVVENESQLESPESKTHDKQHFGIYLREKMMGCMSGPMFITSWPVGADPRKYKSTPLYEEKYNPNSDWRDDLSYQDYVKFIEFCDGPGKEYISNVVKTAEQNLPIQSSQHTEEEGVRTKKKKNKKKKKSTTSDHVDLADDLHVSDSQDDVVQETETFIKQNPFGSMPPLNIVETKNADGKTYNLSFEFQEPDHPTDFSVEHFTDHMIKTMEKARPGFLDNIKVSIGKRKIEVAEAELDAELFTSQADGCTSKDVKDEHVQTDTLQALHKAPANIQELDSNDAKFLRDSSEFLEIMIQFGNAQPKKRNDNLRFVLQGLLDDVLTPELFYAALTKYLEGMAVPPVPSVEYWKCSQSLLQQALIARQITLPGLNIPPIGALGKNKEEWCNMERAKECRNFLQTLMKYGKFLGKIVYNVITAKIQDLINREMEIDAFPIQAKKILKCDLHNHWQLFLQKNLLPLQCAMLTKDVVIEGIQAPTTEVLYINPMKLLYGDQMVEKVNELRDYCCAYIETVPKMAFVHKGEESRKRLLKWGQAIVNNEMNTDVYCNKVAEELGPHHKGDFMKFVESAIAMIRQGLSRGMITIEGIKPPPLRVVEDDMKAAQEFAKFHKECQMTCGKPISDDVKACHKFLSMILQLSNLKYGPVSYTRVLSLTQALVNDTIEPDVWCDNLQEELRGTDCPSQDPKFTLPKFLKQNLPLLREVLQSGDIELDGISYDPKIKKQNELIKKKTPTTKKSPVVKALSIPKKSSQELLKPKKKTLNDVIGCGTCVLCKLRKYEFEMKPDAQPDSLTKETEEKKALFYAGPDINGPLVKPEGFLLENKALAQWDTSEALSDETVLGAYLLELIKLVRKRDLPSSMKVTAVSLTQDLIDDIVFVEVYFSLTLSLVFENPYIRIDHFKYLPFIDQNISKLRAAMLNKTFKLPGLLAPRSDDELYMLHHKGNMPIVPFEVGGYKRRCKDQTDPGIRGMFVDKARGIVAPPLNETLAGITKAGIQAAVGRVRIAENAKVHSEVKKLAEYFSLVLSQARATNMPIYDRMANTVKFVLTQVADPAEFIEQIYFKNIAPFGTHHIYLQFVDKYIGCLTCAMVEEQLSIQDVQRNDLHQARMTHTLRQKMLPPNNEWMGMMSKEVFECLEIERDATFNRDKKFVKQLKQKTKDSGETKRAEGTHGTQVDAKSSEKIHSSAQTKTSPSQSEIKKTDKVKESVACKVDLKKADVSKEIVGCQGDMKTEKVKENTVSQDVCKKPIEIDYDKPVCGDHCKSDVECLADYLAGIVKNTNDGWEQEFFTNKIQDLVDDACSAEIFLGNVDKILAGDGIQHQKYLTFVKKNLANLRQDMLNGKIAIDEVKPPRTDDEIYEAQCGRKPTTPFKEDGYKRTLRLNAHIERDPLKPELDALPGFPDSIVQEVCHTILVIKVRENEYNKDAVILAKYLASIFYHTRKKNNFAEIGETWGALQYLVDNALTFLLFSTICEQYSYNARGIHMQYRFFAEKYLPRLRKYLLAGQIIIKDIEPPRSDDKLYREKYGYNTLMNFNPQEFKDILKHRQIGMPAKPSRESRDQSDEQKAHRIADYFTNILKMAKQKHGKAMSVKIKGHLEALLDDLSWPLTVMEKIEKDMNLAPGSQVSYADIIELCLPSLRDAMGTGSITIRGISPPHTPLQIFNQHVTGILFEKFDVNEFRIKSKGSRPPPPEELTASMPGIMILAPGVDRMPEIAFDPWKIGVLPVNPMADKLMQKWIKENKAKDHVEVDEGSLATNKTLGDPSKLYMRSAFYKDILPRVMGIFDQVDQSKEDELLLYQKLRKKWLEDAITVWTMSGFLACKTATPRTVWTELFLDSKDPDFLQKYEDISLAVAEVARQQLEVTGWMDQKEKATRMKEFDYDVIVRRYQVEKGELPGFIKYDGSMVFPKNPEDVTVMVTDEFGHMSRPDLHFLIYCMQTSQVLNKDGHLDEHAENFKRKNFEQKYEAKRKTLDAKFIGANKADSARNETKPTSVKTTVQTPSAKKAIDTSEEHVKKDNKTKPTSVKTTVQTPTRKAIEPSEEHVKKDNTNNDQTTPTKSVYHRSIGNKQFSVNSSEMIGEFDQYKSDGSAYTISEYILNVSGLVGCKHTSGKKRRQVYVPFMLDNQNPKCNPLKRLFKVFSCEHDHRPRVGENGLYQYPVGKKTMVEFKYLSNAPVCQNNNCKEPLSLGLYVVEAEDHLDKHPKDDVAKALKTLKLQCRGCTHLQRFSKMYTDLDDDVLSLVDDPLRVRTAVAVLLRREIIGIDHILTKCKGLYESGKDPLLYDGWSDTELKALRAMVFEYSLDQKVKGIEKAAMPVCEYKTEFVANIVPPEGKRNLAHASEIESLLGEELKAADVMGVMIESIVAQYKHRASIEKDAILEMSILNPDARELNWPVAPKRSKPGDLVKIDQSILDLFTKVFDQLGQKYVSPAHEDRQEYGYHIRKPKLIFTKDGKVEIGFKIRVQDPKLGITYELNKDDPTLFELVDEMDTSKATPFSELPNLSLHLPKSEKVDKDAEPPKGTKSKKRKSKQQSMNEKQTTFFDGIKEELQHSLKEKLSNTGFPNRMDKVYDQVMEQLKGDGFPTDLDSRLLEYMLSTAHPETMKEFKDLATSGATGDANLGTNGGATGQSQEQKDLSDWEPSDESPKKKSKARICANCKAVAPAPKAFRKCAMCKEANVRDVHYYCSKECQIEDWYARHKRAHKENLLEVND